MFQKKRAISLLLAVVLTVTVAFTGCGTSKPATTSKSLWSDTPVTLTWYTVGNSQSDTQRITDAASKYLADNKILNVKINWQQLGYDGTTYGDKINTMLATGQNADIVFTSNWIANYNTNASSGYFTDLTPYIAKNKDLVDIIGSDYLNASQIGGKNFALPTNKEKAHNWGLLVETKYLTQFNIDPTTIKSMSDIEKYFPQAKAAGLTPVDVSAMNSPYHLLDWDTVLGDDIPGALYPDNRDNTIIDQWVSPESIAMFKTMKTYHDNGWIRADSTSVADQEKELATGKYFCGVWSLVPGKAQSESLSSSQDLTQIDITSPVMSNRETTGAMLAIPMGSQHKDIAFQFIKLLYTDKTLVNLLNFGQKDVDYTLTSDGLVTPTPGAKFAFDSGWIFGNQMNNIPTSNTSADIWTKYAAYNSSAKKENSLGFMYDVNKTAGIKNKISVCTATVDKEYPALLNGTVSNVDTAVAKLKSDLESDGVDAVIADMQSQYNAFLASK
jgi:putative aldouronate transport system substrate-binding protein